MATTTKLTAFGLIASTVAALASGAAVAAKPPAVAIGVPGVPPVFLAVRAYVALDRGLYARYAQDAARVLIQNFATGLDAMQAVENGQIGLAWAPTPAVLAEIARGKPLVAIEGMDRIDWVIGSLDPSVKTCADLKGKTIGIDVVGGSRYDALVAMLSACGLTIKDVTTVSLPGSAAMNAQVAGQLAICVEHFDEIAQIRALGKDIGIVERLSDVDAGQHFGLLVTTRDSLAANRALYVKILEADIVATRWLYKAKNLGTAARIAQITGEDRSVAAAAIAHYVRMDWWSRNSSGLSPARLASTIALNTRLGVIPAGGRTLTPADVSDPSLWRDAQRAVH